jgi:hypothetical protein
VSRVTLLVLVLAGLLLRLAFLSQPMRLDESANYVFLASKSFYTCATVHLDGNNHPLHTILVRLSSMCFGTQPWCLRMPSFVAGVLLVPATALAMKEIFDGPTGLLAGALVVPSAPLLEYSTNARGYSLQTLLFVLLLFSASKVLRDGTRIAWAGVGVFTVLMLYTLPSSIYYGVAIGAWLLLSAARGDIRIARPRFLARLGVTAGCVSAIAVLLYLPFVRTAGLAGMTQNRWVRSLSWGELRGGFAERLREYAVFVHRGLPLPLVVVLVASFVLSLVVFRRMSAFRVSPIVVTLATYLTLMTLQRVLPPERIILPCIPLYLGGSAAGLRWVAGKIAARAKAWNAQLLAGNSGPIMTGALVLFAAGAPGALVLGNGAAYQTPDQVTFREAEPMALVLKEILQKGDVVYAQRDASVVLQYYFALHHVSLDHIYPLGGGVGHDGRAFVIDASKDYFAFTYQLALNDSDLPRSKDYTLLNVAELPYASLYRVIHP